MMLFKVVPVFLLASLLTSHCADASCDIGEEPRDGSCRDCKAGYAKDWEGDDACIKCEPPEYSHYPSGSQFCVDKCGLDYYGESGFVDGSTVYYCEACPFGTYSDNVMTVCEVCPAGTGADTGCSTCAPGEASGGGTDICEKCPAGTYASSEGDKCLPCAPGETSDEGATSCVSTTSSNVIETTTAATTTTVPPPSTTSSNVIETTTAATTTTVPPPPPDDRDGVMAMDPHVQKFDGTWYDYNGECDLVLFSTRSHNVDIEIHVRTTIRYSYSFIETAALRIGDDILEVSGWGGYIVNGVGAATLESDGVKLPNLGNYPVHYSKKDGKQHFFTVTMDDQNNLTLSTFKDFVNVHVHMHHLQNSTGLMGDFVTGKSLARDGVTVLEDPNEFGQEWQVLESESKLFLVDRHPQAPHEKCHLAKKKPQLVSSGVVESNEDKVLRQAAEKACMQWARQNYKSCVIDVVAAGDLELAKATW